MNNSPIKPEPISLFDDEGVERAFILSNFSAIDGREIVMQYPTTGLPLIGDYQKNEETMLKLMKYVYVDVGKGNLISLSTPALINNHCQTWEILTGLEIAMMKKNCSFFRDGKGLNLFERVTEIFLKKVTETLTNLSAQSFPTAKQP